MTNVKGINAALNIDGADYMNVDLKNILQRRNEYTLNLPDIALKITYDFPIRPVKRLSHQRVDKSSKSCNTELVHTS